MLKRSIVIIAMLGQAVVVGLGQGTKADYKRAAEIRGRFSGKVYKEKIHPHWIGGNNFWYETSVRGKREHMLVHGTNGKRRTFLNKERCSHFLSQQYKN